MRNRLPGDVRARHSAHRDPAQQPPGLYHSEYKPREGGALLAGEWVEDPLGSGRGRLPHRPASGLPRTAPMDRGLERFSGRDARETGSFWDSSSLL